MARSSHFCKRCEKQTLHESQSTINHVLHGLLTVMLLGLWGIVWLYLVLADDPPSRCTVCGSVPEPVEKGHRTLPATCRHCERSFVASTADVGGSVACPNCSEDVLITFE